MAEKKTKEIMQEFAIKKALGYLEKDPEKNAPKLMDMVDKVCPDDWYGGARKTIRRILEEKGNWYELVLRIYDLDPGVRKVFFENFKNGLLSLRFFSDLFRRKLLRRTIAMYLGLF